MLNLPTNQQIVERIRADIKSLLPESDPYEVTSILNTLAVANGGRFFEMYENLYQIQKDCFATTASLDALIMIGSVYGVTRLDASSATGLITVLGNDGAAVPAGTIFAASNGTNFATTASVNITSNVQSILYLTRSGTTVTATCSSSHFLATGMSITIVGASESEYNGTFEIVVTSTTTFTYAVSGSPSTPATGAPSVTYVGASVEVESVEQGLSTNQLGGSSLSLASTLIGVHTEAYAQYEGLSGGSDVEDEEDLRSRILWRIQNPITPFNKNTIVLQARTIPGVTRVWVYEPDDLNVTSTPVSIATISPGYVKVTFASIHTLTTGTRINVSGATNDAFNGNHPVLVINPTEVVYFVDGLDEVAAGPLAVQLSTIRLGQTRVFFVRDDDAYIIPDGLEVAAVKTALLDIKPANTSARDIIVQAPSPQIIDFSFSAISPDTPALRLSITNNLKNLFNNKGMGETITSVQYLTAIQNAYDSSTGASLTSFTLDSPSTDIVSGYNVLALLGAITF